MRFIDWCKTVGVNITTMDTVVNKRVYPNFSNLAINSTLFGSPYIAFTFDYGTSDHLNVSSILETYDMRGTFFICGSTIGTNGYLTVSNITYLQSRGHEIGGSTFNNVHLSTLPLVNQTFQIQRNYQLLTSYGLNVSSFAWPYGGDNTTLYGLLNSTGYRRARDVGGYKTQTSCTGCPNAQQLPVPLSSKYVLRSFNVNSNANLGKWIV